MDSFLYWTGAIFWLAILGSVIMLVQNIASNIWWGTLGAFRFRAMTADTISRRHAIKMGLSCWSGLSGRSWQYRGIECPCDARKHGTGDE